MMALRLVASRLLTHVLGWVRNLAGAVAGEYHRLRRHPSLLLVLLAVPTVYPLLVACLYERNQVVERPAVVVDQDNSALSRRLVVELDATQEIRVVRRLDSLEEGWSQVRRQQADLLIFVPDDFSRRIKRREQSRLQLWVNSGNMLTYGAAYGATMAVVGQLDADLGREVLLRRGVGTVAASDRTAPVARVDRLLFHPTGSYGAFFVPGVLLIVMQQAVLVALAFSAGLQREAQPEQGRLSFTTLLGKALAQAPFYLGGTSFIAVVVLPHFGWSGPHPHALLALFAGFCLATVPIGMLLASLVRDRFAAFQLLMLASAPIFLMSGFSWPLDQMPPVVRALASALPSTPALLALRIMTMKTIERQVLGPYLIWLAAAGGLWALLSFVVIRRSWVRPWLRRPTCARG